ncbi:DUF4179 domain-containing protein [Gracilibacillus sp. D59]|uniref:DUF4179 domain-containing protein n=1 Tax=Gracilibacillus sp. D59 TaxID=3457434 RepID=UPI003FCEDD10
MKRKEIRKYLNSSIEKQTPNTWDKIEAELHKSEKNNQFIQKVLQSHENIRKRRYKKLSFTAATVLFAFILITFTPVIASLQGLYDKLFTSEHIDDPGIRIALEQGLGQSINETFYDKKNDITVQFQSIMADDKETKLLLTYQSDETNLENYYLDIFEGDTTIQLVDENGQKKQLDNVGWGSRYYDSANNKVVEALSFSSIKDHLGEEIGVVINNITIYDDQVTSSTQASWRLDFTLAKAAISDRTVMEVGEQFTFENETYTIERVEFSPLETRVVVSGSDIHYYTDENGETYEVFSKLEHQFLNARVIDKEDGYMVDYDKSGVFLTANGKKVEPNFSKGEIKLANGTEYVMVFAPVKEQENLILKVGEKTKIALEE